tara:strand:- start:636 stop:1133 length:498 start_codon:yes stop_codon:yes gene_type:complete
MATPNALLLDGPIPGESLTSELGSRPWDQPPKYTTEEEALDYYIPRLSNPKLTAPMLDIIEDGVSITSVAEMVQSTGVMQGLHTIDVGLLISPVIVELLVTQAEIAEIDYKVGTEEDDSLDSSGKARAIAASSKGYFDDSTEQPMEEPIEAPMDMESGLMSRREV